jgi:ABC-type branched-subunit amino acid transport system substrate-binding protein
MRLAVLRSVARRHWLLLALLLLPPIGAGAQQPDRQTAAVLAAPLSLSGGGESFGGPSLEGIRLAIEEAMASDPALRVSLEVHDDRSDDATARALAERIVAGPTVAVIGPVFSTATLASGPIYAAAGLVALPPTATSDAITQNATTFRVIFKNSDQGEMLAHYLARVLGRRSASVVVVQSGYGSTLREGFETTAARLGIDARFHPLARDADAGAFDALAATLGQARERAVVLLTLDPEGAQLLTRLRRGGHPGPFLGGDAFGDEAFSRLFAAEPEERARPGHFSEGLYALAPVILDSANAETLAFARRFRARFGHDPVWQSVAGYDAARLALIAIRQANAEGAHTTAAQRAGVQRFLLSLNEPSRAQPGLLGPFWFDQARARQQAIRVGRFRGAQFESAPLQVVAVSAPDAAELADGAVFELSAGRYGRLQRVVHTGVYINEIQRVDVPRSTFGADLYLWLRFARDAGPRAADPTDILFPTMLGAGFDPTRPSERRERPDGTQYWLWRVQGEFRNDFELRRYPFDSQTLALPFFNARAANDRIVYVIDRAGMPRGEGSQDAARPITSPDAFRNISQWAFIGAAERRENLVTRSLLGDLDRTAAEGTRELSGFLVTVEIERQSLNALTKVLLPLLVMSLITFASLFFPAALVKEKVTVAITGALSGAVLLGAVHGQLGSIGYTVTAEYVFYVAFILALLCIVSVLGVERLRAAGRAAAAHRLELLTRVTYAAAALAVMGAMLRLALA